MKCYKCGFEAEQDFEACPVCATYVTPVNPVANKVLSLIKDKLFLVLCILLTISCAATIFSGSGFPVTALLTVIFLWIVFSKGQEGIVDAKAMRCVSGVVYAEYVIMNVLAVLFAVLGILMGVLMSFISSSTELMQAFVQGFSISGLPFDIDVTNALAVGIGWAVAAACVFFAAIVFVINLFAWKKLHGFVKSVYKSVESWGTTPVINAKVAKIWLWVFGILSAVGALGSFADILVFAGNGAAAAAYIIGALLVDRYFVEKETFEAPAAETM